MIDYSIEITENIRSDEAGRSITVFGLILKNGDRLLEYRDLCTNKERIELLCEILKEEPPEEKILPELFEDFLF